MQISYFNPLILYIINAPPKTDFVHEKFLVSLSRMMLAEENRLENAAALELMQKSGIGLSTSKKVQGPIELDSDATIAGFVLQQHLIAILGFLTTPHYPTRHAALQLIGTLLRQGMLCPLDVLGHLIGLLGDPHFEIQQNALLLLQCEDEKYSNFLDNRIVEGVELSYYFQLKIAGRAEALVLRVIEEANNNNFSYWSSVFSDLYITCFQKVLLFINIITTYTYSH